MARSKATSTDSLNKAVTAALIIAFGLLALVISYKAVSQSTDDRSKATEREFNLHSCPSNGWLNCMPGTRISMLCNPDFLHWAYKNCPDFKGPAY